jgi:hypothetical protein
VENPRFFSSVPGRWDWSLGLVMSDQWMSLRGYARRRGVSLYAVQTAIKSGRVPKSALQHSEDGSISAIEATVADTSWAANTDAGLAARTGADPMQGAVVRGDLFASGSADARRPAPAATPEDSDTAAYQLSRAKREAAQAEMAQLELQRQLGLLGSIADFQRAATAMAQLVQDRVLQLPSRMSAVLAAETDPVKIEALLMRELKDALDGIAQRAAELAKPAGRTG